MSHTEDHDTARDREQWTRELSRYVVEGGRHASSESDRWFLSALFGLDASAQWCKARFSGATRRVTGEFRKVRFPWSYGKSPRERIEKMLRAEASRSNLDVPEEDFAIFSAKIATLLELVFSGTIRINDIAIEEDDRGGPPDESDRASESEMGHPLEER